MKSNRPRLAQSYNNKISKNFFKNPIKSHCYLWSDLFHCRNHLSFFIVRVRMLWVVISQLPAVFYVIPYWFDL